MFAAILIGGSLQKLQKFRATRYLFISNQWKQEKTWVQEAKWIVIVATASH